MIKYYLVLDGDGKLLETLIENRNNQLKYVMDELTRDGCTCKEVTGFTHYLARKSLDSSFENYDLSQDMFLTYLISSIPSIIKFAILVMIAVCLLFYFL